jgi:DNA-binding LytR/AlgR family response regulator
VDDEKPARDLLKYYLDQIEDVQIVGESNVPVPAIEEINAIKPDVVFLDIDMPILDGFEVIPFLKSKPMIIFCTAFDQHAVKAFEVNALDYLVKPPTQDRIERALKRAKREWNSLSDLKETDGTPKYLSKIVCSTSNRKFHVIWTKDIVSLLKDDPFVVLKTHEGREFLTQLTIGELTDQLDPNLFFQVGRGQIINRDFVTSFELAGSGQWQVKLSGDEAFSVSRRRVREFKEWLNLN